MNVKKGGERTKRQTKMVVDAVGGGLRQKTQVSTTEKP